MLLGPVVAQPASAAIIAATMTGLRRPCVNNEEFIKKLPERMNVDTCGHYYPLLSAITPNYRLVPANIRGGPVNHLTIRQTAANGRPGTLRVK